MENAKSGSGVKAATISNLCGTTANWYKNYISSTYAEQVIEAGWDYKSDGLTLREARKELMKVYEAREEIHTKRQLNSMSQGSAYLSPERYLRTYVQKKKLISVFLRKAERLTEKSFTDSFPFYIPPFKSYRYGVLIEKKEDVDEDWEYYSKAWHRAHGPKRTISNRRIEFSTLNALGNKKIVFSYELEGFRGAYLEKAIISFLKKNKVYLSKKLTNAPAQLSAYFTVKKVREISGYTISRRMLANVKWDWVITNGDLTYHASKEEDLIPGLRKKMNAHIEKENELINIDTALVLGFCRTGIESFCELNDVDINSAYTRKELRNIIVLKREDNCARFAREIKMLGITLHCRR